MCTCGFHGIIFNEAWVTLTSHSIQRSLWARSQSLRIIRGSKAGPPPWGGAGALKLTKRFSRKAYWAKRPTRASLVTVGLRCLPHEVSLSWKSFACLCLSKRPE